MALFAINIIDLVWPLNRTINFWGWINDSDYWFGLAARCESSSHEVHGSWQYFSLASFHPVLTTRQSPSIQAQDHCTFLPFGKHIVFLNYGILFYCILSLVCNCAFICNWPFRSHSFISISSFVARFTLIFKKVLHVIIFMKDTLFWLIF